METYKYIVSKNEESTRLDLFLSLKTKLSRSLILKEIKNENVLVNEKKEKASYSIKANDFIALIIEDKKKESFDPENIGLNIIYEDDEILVINKQFGLVVHPACGNYSGTLLNAILNHNPNSKNIERAGIVHRLDKDTSGIMVIAKTIDAFLKLSNDFKERKIHKTYLGLVYGKIENEGKIEIPIGRDKKNRKKISPNSLKLRNAITYFTLEEYFPKDDISLVKFNIETGRTHQIRVHSKAIGFPILGDKVYGKRKEKIKLDRQMLHSFEIAFFHPKENIKMKFQASLPNDFNDLLNFLRGKNGTM